MIQQNSTNLNSKIQLKLKVSSFLETGLSNKLIVILSIDDNSIFVKKQREFVSNLKKNKISTFKIKNVFLNLVFLKLNSNMPFAIGEGYCFVLDDDTFFSDYKNLIDLFIKDYSFRVFFCKSPNQFFSYPFMCLLLGKFQRSLFVINNKQIRIFFFFFYLLCMFRFFFFLRYVYNLSINNSKEKS